MKIFIILILLNQIIAICNGQNSVIEIIKFPDDRNYTTIQGNDSLVLLHDWTTSTFQVVNINHKKIMDYEFKRGKGPLEIQEVNDYKIIDNYIAAPDYTQAKLVLISLNSNEQTFEVDLKFPFDKIAYDNDSKNIRMFSIHNKKIGLLNLKTGRIENRTLQLPKEYLNYHSKYNFDATDGYPMTLGSKIYTHIFKYPKIIEIDTPIINEYNYSKKDVVIKNTEVLKSFENQKIIRSNVKEFESLDFTIYNNNYVFILATGVFEGEKFSNQGVYSINMKNKKISFFELPYELKGIHCSSSTLFFLTINNLLASIPINKLHLLELKSSKK